MTDKPKPLKVQEEEVQPQKMPRTKRVVMPPQEDPPREPDEGTTTLPPEVDTRPRAERRRSHREEQKLKKEQAAQAKKYMQQMAKPIRFRDMGTIVNQVYMQFQPIFNKFQDEIDKLSYLPDYLADMAEAFEIETPISISHFEEWFKKLKEELEAEELAKLEAEDSPSTTSTTSTTVPPTEEEEGVSHPETEETQ